MSSILIIGDIENNYKLQQIHAKLLSCKNIEIESTKQLQASLQKTYDIYIYDTLQNPKSLDNISAKQAVYASTHHGIQTLDLEKVQYFVADQKYVNAIHTGGVLLISDTLADLEERFGQQFIRVHRKYLVATKLIHSLIKIQENSFVLKLHQVNQEIPVSRRRVAKVREFIKKQLQ